MYLYEGKKPGTGQGISGSFRLCEFLQPAPILIRFISGRDAAGGTAPLKKRKPNGAKGGAVKLEDWIWRVIRAALESFPIDETKKEDLLQKIIDEETAKENG